MLRDSLEKMTPQNPHR